LTLIKSYIKQKSLEMFLKCCLSHTITNVSSRQFQVVGAEMANALSVNRSQLSVHGLHSSHSYDS